MRQILAFLLLGLAAATPLRADPAPPRFTEVPASGTTLDALRAGGFILYLRHTPTDNTRADRLTGLDLDDCATQRPLSGEGRRMAVAIGEAMRLAAIPIGDIHASPMCRTRDTAQAAFPGRAIRFDPLLIYTANLTSAEKTPVLARTRELLSQPVAAGTNRLIVGHSPNLMDIMGYFPQEGTVVVFRPLDDGFAYVASIPAGLWPLLQDGRTGR